MDTVGPLLERDGILAEILAVVDAAKEAGGAVLLIDGEAGAGKTSVVRAVVERLPSRLQVLVGSCDPLTTPRPFGPLHDIADAHPELGYLVAELDSPHRAFSELLEHLRRSIRPVVLVIEDLHWADDATLDMLTYLGRRISTTEAVVLVTYRGDEIAPGDPVGITVGGLLSQRDTVHRLELAALSLDAVRTLAGAERIDAASIHRISGGNAFFVTEMLAGDDELPTTVQGAVLARVGRLPSAVRASVEAVSVAPRALERAYVGQLVESSAYTLDDAVHAGVLIGEADGYRFRHELARRAVEDSIPVPRRIELHRRMLEVLTTDGSADLARLAHHAIRTSDGSLILEHVPAAARDSALRRSVRQAASFYDAARPYIGELAVEERITFLTDHATTLIAVDRQAEARDISQEVLDLAEATGDPRPLSAAYMLHGRVTWLNGNSQEATRLTEEAIRLLEPYGDSEELARLLYVGGTNQMLDRHRDAALDLAERSLAMARRLESRSVETLGMIGLGTAELVVGDPDRGVELLESAYAMADTDRIRGNALSMLGTGGGEVKLYDRALRWLDATIELGSSHDEDYSVAYATAWISRIKAEQGHWDEALAYAEKVANLPPEVARISPVTALGTIGRIGVRRGRSGATEALDRAIELGGSGAIQHIWVPLCALAEYHIYRDDPGEAAAVLAEPLTRILDTDTRWGRGEIAFWMWMAGGLTTTPDHLAEPYRMMIDGDWHDASLAWRAIGSPYEEAMALSLGPPAAALTSLDLFDTLGARPMAQRIRRRLRADGISSVPRGPTRSTAADPDGLTVRQREVLDLMAEGLSNGDIAQRLFVSRKTIENHVSAILLKLEATSRSEAVARAHHPGR